MKGATVDARRYSRVQLPTPAEVSWASVKQTAHLRDISAGGAFLYAQMSPDIGTVMKIDFIVRVVGGEIRISCEGQVVRVEPQALGDQSGLAIQFSSLDLGASSW